MSSEIKDIIFPAACTIIGAALVFIWGMIDISAKVKKIDKVDKIDEILAKLEKCIDSLNQTMKEQAVHQKETETRFKHIEDQISEIKLDMYRRDKMR